MNARRFQRMLRRRARQLQRTQRWQTLAHRWPGIDFRPSTVLYKAPALGKLELVFWLEGTEPAPDDPLIVGCRKSGERARRILDRAIVDMLSKGMP